MRGRLLAAAVVAIGLIAPAWPARAAEPDATGSWAPIHSNRAHWVACSTITYNLIGTPTHTDLLRDAMDSVSAHTGLRFRFAPASVAARLRITFYGEGENRAMTEAGIAAQAHPGFPTRVAGVGFVLTQAFIDVDKAALERGYWSDALKRAVFMHELGHAVGLAHVADRDQLMNGDLLWSLEWGAGDLAGFRALYPTAAECRRQRRELWDGACGARGTQRAGPSCLGPQRARETTNAPLTRR